MNQDEVVYLASLKVLWDAVKLGGDKRYRNYGIQLLRSQGQINTRTGYYKATELRPEAATPSWGQNNI